MKPSWKQSCSPCLKIPAFSNRKKPDVKAACSICCPVLLLFKHFCLDTSILSLSLWSWLEIRGRGLWTVLWRIFTHLRWPTDLSSSFKQLQGFYFPFRHRFSFPFMARKNQPTCRRAEIFSFPRWREETRNIWELKLWRLLKTKARNHIRSPACGAKIFLQFIAKRCSYSVKLTANHRLCCISPLSKSHTVLRHS